MFKAFGETKTLTAWARDPRNTAGMSYCGLEKRILRGLSMEEALTMPKIESGKYFTLNGVTKTIQGWADSPENIHGLSTTTLSARLGKMGYTIEQALSEPRGWGTFVYEGERKSLRRWAEDPRCVANWNTLRNRINDGWPIDRALTHPVRNPGRVYSKKPLTEPVAQI